MLNSRSMLSSSRCQHRRMRMLISQRSCQPTEHVSIHTYLYHIRSYCSSWTRSTMNEIYLRRLLKSNYACQYQESSNPTSEHRLLTNKSTFILGQYMLTLHSDTLQLYSIDQHRLTFIDEQVCTMKIVFVGICTYSHFQTSTYVKQDGFVLMTADQRLLLYDFKLQSRMPLNGISFQCDLPVKFPEKSFEYHEENHMISIHTRYKHGSHVFIVIRLWPCWLSYVFVVDRHIFGRHLKQAAITHELLIVQNQQNK
jgi:hypothetical protein